MAIKKTPKALTAVKSDFVDALQNVITEGSLLLSALDAALSHGAVNGRVADLIKERTEAFKTALYGKDD